LEPPIRRRSSCTVTPAGGRATAAARLQAARPGRPSRAAVTVAARLDLIRLTAARRRSFPAVVRRFRFGFCHQTARRARGANRPPTDRLAGGLVNAPRASRRARRARGGGAPPPAGPL
jgi:hypothetical protein